MFFLKKTIRGFSFDAEVLSLSVYDGRNNRLKRLGREYDPNPNDAESL